MNKSVIIRDGKPKYKIFVNNWFIFGKSFFFLAPFIEKLRKRNKIKLKRRRWKIYKKPKRNRRKKNNYTKNKIVVGLCVERKQKEKLELKKEEVEIKKSYSIKRVK